MQRQPPTMVLKEVGMDLREKKTQKSIRNAFLQIRARKDLGKITVKELASAAEISKATFYLHYRDIYDLSEKMQSEVIRDVLEGIGRPELFFHDKAQFLDEFLQSFYAKKSMIDILFGGSQNGILALSIEREMKDYLIKMNPDLQDDAEFNTRFTYWVMGGFYAFWENTKRFSTEEILQTLKAMIQE